MIKCNKGIVEFEGEPHQIMAEYSALTLGIFNWLVENLGTDEKSAWKLIDRAIEQAHMKPEELIRKFLELSPEEILQAFQSDKPTTSTNITFERK